MSEWRASIADLTGRLGQSTNAIMFMPKLHSS